MPFDSSIETLSDLPYTLSYIIRKRRQVDSLRELPKDKRPTDKMIWEGTSEEIDDWLDKVFKRKNNKDSDISVFEVDEHLIED